MVMFTYRVQPSLTETNKQQVIIMEDFKRENMMKDVIFFAVAATCIVLPLSFGISIVLAVI